MISRTELSMRYACTRNVIFHGSYIREKREIGQLGSQLFFTRTVEAIMRDC